jgi:hypothetical protein
MQAAGYSKIPELYEVTSRKMVILRKQIVIMLTGLNWLRIGLTTGVLAIRNERCGFIRGVNSWNTSNNY